MKTISLKKVAVVAVASLGFGLLSVVPAQAASSAAVVGTATQAAVVGTASTTTVGSTIANTDTNPGTLSLTVPTGSSVTMADRDGSFSAATTAVLTSAVAGFAFTASTGAVAITATPTSFSGTVTIVPDVPGLYAITFTAAGAGGGVAAATARMQAAGAAGTVASSGRGSTSISAVSGGIAQFTYTTPDATASGDVFRFVSSGVGAITAATGVAADGTTANNPTEASGVAGNWSSGATWARSNASAGTATITVSSAVAGTQTVTINSINATTGAPTAAATMTITWGATPAFSSGTTTSIRNATTGTNATSDATILVSKSLATQAANIIVTVRDGAGSALTGQTISASVSGPGLIGATAGAAAGNATARVASVTLSASQNVASIHVWADGTSGVGTVTILVGSAVAATETVNFFDSPATVTAVQNHKILSSSGGAAGITPAANAGSGADIANTPAVILTVRDKNGLDVTGLTTANISAVSSDPTVMSSTITLAQSDGTGAANPVSNNYNVQVSSVAKASGSTATLTFRVALGTTPETYVTATPLTYTLGGAPQTVILGLDRTSYTPGQAASVSLALRDSSGNPARDGDHTGVLAGALSSNLGIQGTVAFNATATTVSSLGGVAVVKVNAPATGGTWTVSGTTGSSTSNLATAERAKAISVSATVVSENAALLTQIDALNAKIVALNALIAKIMKKLGVK